MNRKTARKRILTIFVCIFLGALLIFGIVTGAIIAARNVGAVARAGAVVMDDGVASYFASTFKKTYFATVDGPSSDTEEFWSSSAGDGKTHGERFKEELKIYLSEIIAGNLIYNSQTVLSETDKRIIENTADDVLYWSADKSVDKFNEMTVKYGYDYDDFCRALELLYKAERAKEIVYGTDGKNLDSSLADKYLAKYTHVSLAFIRTDYAPKVNETTGRVEFEKISDSDAQLRQEKIDEIQGYIDNSKTGVGDAMTLATFREILSDYDADPDVDFYFLDGIPSTEDFSLQYPGVVEMALSMQELEFGYVEINIPANENEGFVGFVGTCFIYKTAPVSGAYLDKDNTFFEDFYFYASRYFYSENLKEFSRDVEFTEIFDRIDFADIPENKDIFFESWVLNDGE